MFELLTDGVLVMRHTDTLLRYLQVTTYIPETSCWYGFCIFDTIQDVDDVIFELLRLSMFLTLVCLFHISHDSKQL